MFDYILKIVAGTIQHVKNIDNIVDLAIFVVSFLVCSFASLIAIGFIVLILADFCEGVKVR